MAVTIWPMLPSHASASAPRLSEPISLSVSVETPASASAWLRSDTLTPTPLSLSPRPSMPSRAPLMSPAACAAFAALSSMPTPQSLRSETMEVVVPS